MVDDERTDFELLALWRNGDQRAANVLVKRHYAPLRRFLAGKINEGAAWVIAQDAFLALCEDLNRFKGYSSFRTYLFGIGRWKLIEYIRSTRKQGERFNPIEESVADVKLDARLSSMFGVRQYEQFVVSALRSLPLDHQLMLSLKGYQCMTSREIGEIFAMTASQIDGQIHRARTKLQRQVEAMTHLPGQSELPPFDLEACVQDVLSRMMSEPDPEKPTTLESVASEAKTLTDSVANRTAEEQPEPPALPSEPSES